MYSNRSRSYGGFGSRAPNRRGYAPHRGGRSGGGNPWDKKIDVTKFINKAVITEDAPNFVPEHSFTDFKIFDVLKKNILAKGYTAPTPIQDRAIPHVLQGRDVVGIANTGTGKTAAFLIPLINKILINRNENVLVVVPTRELARKFRSTHSCCT